MLSMRTVYRIIRVYCALVVGGMVAAGQSSNMPVTPWQALKQSRYVKPALGVAGVLTAAALTALLVRSHQKSSKNNEYPQGKSLNIAGMSTPISAASTPFHSPPASPKVGPRSGGYTAETDDDQEGDDDEEVILDFSHLCPPERVIQDSSLETIENSFTAYFNRYMHPDACDKSIGYINTHILYSGLYYWFSKGVRIGSPFSAFFSTCNVLVCSKGRCAFSAEDLGPLYRIFRMIPSIDQYWQHNGIITIPAIIGFADSDQSRYYIGLVHNNYDNYVCEVFAQDGVKRVLQSGECFFGQNQALILFCIASKSLSDRLTHV